MALELKTINPTLLAARPAKEGTNMLSPIARISHPAFFTPRASGKNPKPDAPKKYQVSIVVPTQADISLLKKMAGDAALKFFGDTKLAELKAAKKLKSPFLRAGDNKFSGELAEWTLIRMSAKSKPDVFEPNNGALIKLTEEDSTLVYPGRWATVSMHAFAYDTNGNYGVSFGFNSVVLLNHDESFTGRARGADEFDEDVVGYGTTPNGDPKHAPKSIDDVF